MNGAESLVHTLLAGGIDTVFANPGTSEMHFVAALDRIPGLDCVLCLDEGVVAGAADGYWRMAGRPAATLLHCGPGLANALSNLHNARRARSGIVNVVGDQATYHRPLDPPLTADTEGWARPVSAFVRTATSAARVGHDAAAAIEAAGTGHGQVATLVLPADTAWDEGGEIGAPKPPPPRALPDVQAIERVAKALRSGRRVTLLLGGSAMRERPLALAAGIAAATGARLHAEMFNARIERGAGRFPITRIPYAIDKALEMLAGTEDLVLVEATPPVSFFAYPGKRGRLWPDDCTITTLARPEQDGAAALAALADLLGAKPAPAPRREKPLPSTGKVAPEAFAASLGALLPDNAIVVDEGISFARGLFPATEGAAPHDWVALGGGAIGDGIPLSLGTAIGARDRRVVALQADGSAMYTISGLWTAARCGLDITYVVFANRKYAILLHELAGVGANPGRTALDMLDIGRPDLDFVRIAEGMGVAAARAEDLGRFNDLFTASIGRKGPFLIELSIG